MAGRRIARLSRTGSPGGGRPASVADEGESRARPGGSRRRAPWEAISALIAGTSVVIALVFSAIQVNSNTDAQNSARRANEAQLLTQMDASVAQATAVFRDPVFLEEAGRGELSAAMEDRLRAALRKLDFLAYLFNNDYITLPGARELWVSDMSCAWLTGSNFLERAEQRLRQYPELREAVRGEACKGPRGRFEVP